MHVNSHNMLSSVLQSESLVKETRTASFQESLAHQLLFAEITIDWEKSVVYQQITDEVAQKWRSTKNRVTQKLAMS